MRRVVLSFVAALLAQMGAHAWAAPADELRTLVQKGRSAEAYAAGTRHPAELGDPDFDFYFGVAAIDSGHAAEGVVVLERYLARFPADDRARFNLARGYYALGELLRARQEFETVIKHRPAPDRRATIERFLDSIQARRAVGIIRENLGWALLYNALAVPLAAAGWVSAGMRENRLVRIVFFFVQTNLALAQAALSFMAGRRMTTWTPSKR